MEEIESKDKFRELEKRGILPRFWNCTFEEFEKGDIPPQVRRQYGLVRQYALDISANIKSGRGLILKGPVGTMKTSLAVAVLRVAIDMHKTGFFVATRNLADNLIMLRERNKKDWLDYDDSLRRTGLLVLDDLGLASEEGWVLKKIEAIISERYDRMKPIIITTNLSNDGLMDKYAERIIDRLRSSSKMINFQGDSLRESVV